MSPSFLYVMLKYVAVTRAKENVIISTNKAINTGNMSNTVAEQTKSTYTNHSGGALGADTAWGEIGAKYGVTSNHYYMGEKTPNGNFEISEQDAKEGASKVAQAAKANFGYKYATMSDTRLIRNWSQVKYADAVFAVGNIAKPGEKLFPSQKNDTRVALQPAVTGGTGYAVTMAIQAGKPVYVFDQTRGKWFTKQQGKQWAAIDTPTLTNNFAGIGTREINASGMAAIEAVYAKTFAEQSQQQVEGNSIQNMVTTNDTAAREAIVKERSAQLEELINTRTDIDAQAYRTEFNQILEQYKNSDIDSFNNALMRLLCK